MSVELSHEAILGTIRTMGSLSFKGISAWLGAGPEDRRRLERELQRLRVSKAIVFREGRWWIKGEGPKRCAACHGSGMVFPKVMS